MTEDVLSDGSASAEFDTHDPAIAADPFPTYAQLREGCPVKRTSAWGGYWVSAGHTAVATAARDGRFSTGQVRPDGVLQGVSTPPPGHTGRMIPLELDVPESLKYRKILSAFYSPSRVGRREGEFRELARSCVDAIVDCGEADLVDALTLRLPAILTMRDIGLPESDWAEVEAGLHRAMLGTPHDPEGAREAAQQVCLGIIEAVDSGSGGDGATLIDHLVHSEIAGEPVAISDIVSMLYLLLLGTDPTSTLTATALWHIGRTPQLRETLLREPSRIGQAADEFVRWVSPVQGTFRTLKEDTRICGVPVSRGDRVLLSWASANRDENVFERGNDVLLDRDNSRQLAFGGGPHFCLGAAMVRSMFTVMVEEVLGRIGDYEVVEEDVDWFPDLSSVYGVRVLPVRFGVPSAEVANGR